MNMISSVSSQVKPDERWATCGAATGWKYTSTRPNLPRDTYPLLVEHMCSSWAQHRRHKQKLRAGGRAGGVSAGSRKEGFCCNFQLTARAELQ